MTNEESQNVDEPEQPVERGVSRRDFLVRAWQTGIVLIAVAGVWTSVDVLRSVKVSGIGGLVPTVPPKDVAEAPVYVRSAQSYLTRIDDEVIALWQRCPHLGCRVAWCESSREFECACHGSTFNRAGEVRSGPSPRGMDKFEVVADGEAEVVVVDTGVVIQGLPPGPESIDEPPQGPPCSGHT